MSSSFKAPNKEDLRVRYEKDAPLYDQLIVEACYVLNEALRRHEIKISNIEFRKKDFDHFYDKIVRKEIDGNVFEKVEDIAGVRIICPYRSDLGKIETVIKSKFEVLESKIMHNLTDTPFGYMSDHYVVKLPSNYSGERYDRIKNLKCEIQVRTVSMHAWDTISHLLEYKQEIDIPSELKNDFHALSGVFYIADSLFEQFRSARERSMHTLNKKMLEKGFDFDAEINLDTLKVYLSWRFPNRHSSGGASRSSLLQEVKNYGILNFRDLDVTIDDRMKWFQNYEKGFHSPFPGRDYYFSQEGVARVILRDFRQIK